MVSTNRLKERRSQFAASEWIMDSGAFTAITTLGCLPEPPEEYAEEDRKRRGEGFTYASSETVVQRGDLLIVAGRTADTERFAELS